MLPFGPTEGSKPRRVLHTMRPDLADLRLFLCVVDAGSITRGAALAHLALASASERLRNLETEMGVALLERRPRGISTTDAGAALAHHARIILRQQTLLRGELRDFAQGVRGTLHLHANTAALTGFLPRAIAPWLAAHPRLHVDLKERSSVDIVAAILSGQVEAGIASDAVEAPRLQRRPLAQDPLVLIVPRQHRLAGRRSADFTEVLNEPFVGLSCGDALQAHLEERARAQGSALRIRIRMKTFDGLCDLVAHGVGVGVVPRRVLRRGRQRPAFATLALSNDWARRRLCAWFRDWRTLSAPMRSLLGHLGITAAPDVAAGARAR